MATCDLLELLGQKPTNFLDLSGQVYHEMISSALVMMEKDENVDSILINVFCGHLPADKIAMVIKDNKSKNYLTKPVICRFKGHNAELANQILDDLNDPYVITESEYEASC